MKKKEKLIIYLDESGRGSLAGPVIAAAVLMNARFKKKNAKFQFKVQNVKDSKKLNQKKRRELYKILRKYPGIEWAIGRVSEKIIDKINILEATKLAMQKALKKLKRKPRLLILDGNFKINSQISQKSIIKADEKILGCKIASIIAKVTRDRIMENYHQKFPQYGFAKHKGYGTKLHLKMLKKYGPCKIHRKTFAPVRVS